MKYLHYRLRFQLEQEYYIIVIAIPFEVEEVVVGCTTGGIVVVVVVTGYKVIFQFPQCNYYCTTNYTTKKEKKIADQQHTLFIRSASVA